MENFNDNTIEKEFKNINTENDEFIYNFFNDMENEILNEEKKNTSIDMFECIDNNKIVENFVENKSEIENFDKNTLKNDKLYTEIVEKEHTKLENIDFLNLIDESSSGEDFFEKMEKNDY